MPGRSMIYWRFAPLWRFLLRFGCLLFSLAFASFLAAAPTQIAVAARPRVVDCHADDVMSLIMILLRCAIAGLADAAAFI